MTTPDNLTDRITDTDATRAGLRESLASVIADHGPMWLITAPADLPGLSFLVQAPTREDAVEELTCRLYNVPNHKDLRITRLS